ncbi:MAG: type I restriction-modification system subunit M, partial [Bacteroidales bacterium]
FTSLVRKGQGKVAGTDNYILDELQRILTHIEQTTMGTASEDDFNALFEDIDLNSTKLGRTAAARNEIVVQILEYLDAIDFRLEDTEADVLGDAYEYLISKFAANAGKSAGEFYTPQQVSKILAKIVTSGKERIRNVYDPTCGSGSLLLRVAKETQVTDFYGQELTHTTYNLARMNMLLHGVHYRNFHISHDDTLENPQNMGMHFEAIVANPPFSANWKGEGNPLNSTDERFSQYGKLAPKTKADFAFVQHMVYHLADNGTMACVLPHGVLFRGAAEGVIRKYLIENLNYIDAVIGLPANVFYGTSIPTSILVIKKCRRADDSILFIDASGDDFYEKQKTQNVLRDSDVERIVELYTRREEVEKLCHVAALDEVRENDYNLNIPRYVDTFEEEERIDIEAIAGEYKALATESAATDARIDAFCRELGIDNPFV